jgi:hypothetical protein
MGKGIDAARATAPEHAALIDDMKDQLLIVLLKRLGGKDGKVDIPVAEVDGTGRYVVLFSVRDRVFHFTVQEKA